MIVYAYGFWIDFVPWVVSAVGSVPVLQYLKSVMPSRIATMMIKAHIQLGRFGLGSTSRCAIGCFNI
jgi:hypothetical protein